MSHQHCRSHETMPYEITQAYHINSKHAISSNVMAHMIAHITSYHALYYAIHSQHIALYYTVSYHEVSSYVICDNIPSPVMSYRSMSYPTISDGISYIISHTRHIMYHISCTIYHIPYAMYHISCIMYHIHCIKRDMVSGHRFSIMSQQITSCLWTSCIIARRLRV